MNSTSAILCGVAGAVLAELIKQRGKWSSMENEMFYGQFKRIAFWLIIITLLACGGVSGYFAYEDFSDSIKYKHCFAAGAGAEAFIRQLASSVYGRQGIDLGGDDDTDAVSGIDESPPLSTSGERKKHLPSIKDILR